jgi:hypothetical protein
MSQSIWGKEIPLYEISVGTGFDYTLPPHVFIRWTDYGFAGFRASREKPYPFAAIGARVYAEPVGFGIDPVYDPTGKLRIVGMDARLPKSLEARVGEAAAPLIAHLIDLRTKMDAAFGERTLIWLRPDTNDFGIQFADDLMVYEGKAYRIRSSTGRIEVPLDDRATRFLAIAPAIERDLRAAILATFGSPLPRVSR